MNTKELFKVGNIVFINGTGFGQIESNDGVILYVKLFDNDIIAVNTNDEIVYSFNYDMFYKLFSGTNMTNDNIFEVLTYLEYNYDVTLIQFESDYNDICIAEQHEYTTIIEVYNLLKSSENRYSYEESLSEKIERKRKELEDEVRDDLIELVISKPIKEFFAVSRDLDETVENLYESGLLDVDTYVVSPSISGELCIVGYNSKCAIMVDHESFVGEDDINYKHIEFQHLSLDNMERLIRLIEQN